MQRVIQQWGGDLMEVTGGALASDKTYWYLVEFVWKRGKWVAADSPLEFELIAKTEDNNFVSLNRLSSEMLGIWMAPNGSKTKMIQEMRTSAVEWGAKIRNGGSVAGLAFHYCCKTQIPIGSLHLHRKGVYLDYGTCNKSSSPKIRDIAYNDYQCSRCTNY